MPQKNVSTVLQCKLMGKKVFLGTSVSCNGVIPQFGHFRDWRSSWGLGEYD